MKVKIVKASQPTYWYANNIGETFEVDDIAGCYGYNVINNPNFTHHYIQQRDCEIISEPVKIPFTFSAWDKDRSQKVWTRDGRVVKDVFYCPNRGSEYKIGGIIESELNMFRDNGYYCYGTQTSPKDLFLEHTEKEYFVNVYKRENGTLYTKSADCHDLYEDASVWSGQVDNFVKTISFKA